MCVGRYQGTVFYPKLMNLVVESLKKKGEGAGGGGSRIAILSEIVTSNIKLMQQYQLPYWCL